MGAAILLHDIAVDGLTIPISNIDNGREHVYITITADANLNNGNTRANMQHSNDKNAPEAEWFDVLSVAGPRLIIDGTIELKTNEFYGGFLRIQLAGSASAGLLTIKTYYKE